MTQPRSFTRRREDFTCLRCGLPVRGSGYTNHCPRCLWSRHVDVNPGDRAAGCGGAMEPVGVLAHADRVVLVHQCVVCGHARRNRSAADDDSDALLGLFGRPVPDCR
ncbi:MAG: RNHCP domain-containing protein [Pseudonocardiaceae bacterium]